MKAGGLTHGGFYAYFASKQDLQKAAIAFRQEVSASRARDSGRTRKGRKAYADRYLSPRHRDNHGYGCTMAALGQEVAAQRPNSKRHSRGDSKTASLNRAATGRKPFSREPHSSARLCLHVVSRTQNSRMKFSIALARRSADCKATFSRAEASRAASESVPQPSGDYGPHGPTNRKSRC